MNKIKLQNSRKTKPSRIYNKKNPPAKWNTVGADKNKSLGFVNNAPIQNAQLILLSRHQWYPHVS